MMTSFVLPLWGLGTLTQRQLYGMCQHWLKHNTSFWRVYSKWRTYNNFPTMQGSRQRGKSYYSKPMSCKQKQGRSRGRERLTSKAESRNTNQRDRSVLWSPPTMTYVQRVPMPITGDGNLLNSFRAWDVLTKSWVTGKAFSNGIQRTTVLLGWRWRWTVWWITKHLTSSQWSCLRSRSQPQTSHVPRSSNTKRLRWWTVLSQNLYSMPYKFPQVSHVSKQDLMCLQMSIMLQFLGSVNLSDQWWNRWERIWPDLSKICPSTPLE